MQVTIKFKLKDLNYVVSDKNKVYRLPNRNGRYFMKAKKIELSYHQGQNKYILAGKRYTIDQVKELAIPLKKSYILEVESKKPFENE